MVEKRKTIGAVILLLVAAADVLADMMPVPVLDAGDQPRAPVCASNGVSRSRFPSLFVGCVDSAYLNVGPLSFLPETGADITLTSAAPPLQVFAGGQSSLSLCLYALLGLGLCRSAPWVKRLSPGAIPDWYHTGGPSQIGHSLAAAPNGLSLAQVHCFIQPDSTPADAPSRYRVTAVASIWRGSHLSPMVLASRGPPHLS